MRWADVYVCMLADGVALRNRCPQGQADPRAAIDGGASGVTMAARTPARTLGAPGTLGSEPAGPMASHERLQDRVAQVGKPVDDLAHALGRYLVDVTIDAGNGTDE